MRRVAIVLQSMLLLLAVPFAQGTSSAVTMDSGTTSPFFTENAGQWDTEVLFRSDVGDAVLWILKSGVRFQLISMEASEGDDVGRGSGVLSKPARLRQSIVDARLIDANVDPGSRGEGRLPHKSNFFIGDDPARWRAGAASYSSVVIENVYDGIDLRYYNNSQNVEYDFEVSPGSDHSQVVMEIDGAESFRISSNGELIITSEWGEIQELAPIAYQSVDGSRRPVAAGFQILSENRVGFELGPGIDPSAKLVIDPELIFSTYLGGAQNDHLFDMVIDPDGNAYVAGWTQSMDFPVEDPIQGTDLTRDAFISKFSADGSALLHSTYLGGSGNDYGNGVALDQDGRPYVTGSTESTNFPTVNPYMTDPGDGNADAFISRLNADGDALDYSTYYGGNDADDGAAIALGEDGDICIAGSTLSTNLPLQFPSQINQIGRDAFVIKLDSSGAALELGTYLGGSDNDVAYDLTVDHQGYIYVTGATTSSDFPTINSFQTFGGIQDAFVAKYHRIIPPNVRYTRLIGGSSNDQGIGIAVDSAEQVYVVGWTESSDFPVSNELYGPQGGRDGFITKLPRLANLELFSTYIGGSSHDFAFAVSNEFDGRLYVSGQTGSGDFPTVNPYQTHQADDDAFAIVIDTAGSSLIFGTYLGGDDDDQSVAVAELDGYLYLAGQTNSSDFPTQNPYQTDMSFWDSYVSKLRWFNCGDADVSGAVDIDDVVFLIAYIFGGGPAPVPVESGDADCSGGVDIDDVVYLIAYIFGGGNPPCDTDGNGIPDC